MVSCSTITNFLNTGNIYDRFKPSIKCHSFTLAHFMLFCTMNTRYNDFKTTLGIDELSKVAFLMINWFQDLGIKIRKYSRKKISCRVSFQDTTKRYVSVVK